MEMMGVIGQVAGAAGSFGGGGGPEPSPITFDATGYANKANDFLDQALGSAIKYSEKYTEKAADKAKLGDEVAQARNAPYKLAGYTGLDHYLDSMAVERPEMGSFVLANALEKQANRVSAMDNMARTAGDISADEASGLFGGWGDQPGLSGNKVTGLPSGNMSEADRVRQQGEMVARINYGKSAYDKGQMDPTYANFMSAAGQMSAPNVGGFQVDSPQAYLEGLAGMSKQLLNEGRYYGGGSIPEAERKAIAAQAREASRAVTDYDAATRYWTPEMGSIARGYQTGLFSAPKWVNV